MYVKCEIKYCRPGRKLAQLAGRSEYEYIACRYFMDFVFVICGHRVGL